MEIKLKINMRIMKTIIGICVCLLLISFKMHAESLNDKIYCIVNPTSGAQIITNKEGEVLLANTDPDFESIEIVYDVLSNEQSFLFKNYKGEHPVDVVESAFEKEPSSRAVFYSLNGEEIGFEIEDFLKAGSVGNKVLCSCIDKLVVFDTLKKEKREYTPRAFVGCGNVILLYDNSLFFDTKGVLILDKDLNELHRYDEYIYFENKDAIKIDNKQYKRIRKLIDSNRRIYTFNMLDENGNKIFPEDFENEIEFDTRVEELLFGNVIIKYDFVNQMIVSTPSIISEEQREMIVNDTAYARLMQKPNEIFESLKYSDENIEKIKSTISTPVDSYLHVYKWSYEDKVLYYASYHGGIEIATWSTADGTIEEEGTYWFSYNIYDGEANLLFENVAEWDLLTNLKDYGYLGIKNGIYDFDMNKVAECDEDDRFEIYKIDNRTYFVNNYKRVGRHFREEKHNSIYVYDDMFNELFSNLEDFKYFEKTKLIAMTDKDSTKFYDDKFRILKDLNTKVYMIHNYTDKYYTFINNSMDRYGIVDRNGKICVSGLKKVSHLADDYFVYQNGFRYGIMDYEGNAIMSFSIFDSWK